MKRRNMMKAVLAAPAIPALTLDKSTGRVNGVNFVDRKSKREMHAKARVVVLGASCLESTCILLNSGIANSSGVLGRYLHDQFYVSNGVVAIVPEARNGNAPRGLMGGGGYIPRFKNITTKEKNFIRGYAFDFFAGGTPDAKYFGSWGEQLQKDIDVVRGASVSGTLVGEVLPRYENHVSIDKKSRTPSAFPS
jgi:hypothetical protein